MTEQGLINSPHSALFTDLYELTMLQAYYAEGMTGQAVFELYFRELPAHRNYVMAAGLDDVLSYLESLHFTQTELAWLADEGRFSDEFLATLRSFHFTGEVFAVPEGTLVFEHEPIIQIVASLPEAQLVETYVLNQAHLQSVAATKAARVVIAAEGRDVVDFGSRRSHGTDAALKVARTSYLAGASGTSNVLASRYYDIPAIGTMAHSYIQAHSSEEVAFEAFARIFPNTTLLVDTYDTLDGVHKVIALSRKVEGDFAVAAIRLDSGDLARLAKAARALLDEAGLSGIKIFASGGLNEYKIRALLKERAPIDGFGVGTDMAVSSDAPEIDFSYKLVEYDGKPRMKLAPNKVIMPTRKQVFRQVEDGKITEDVIAKYDENLNGEPLLRQVMKNGKRLEAGCMSLGQAREYARKQLKSLPDRLTALERIEIEHAYPVLTSTELHELTERVRTEVEA